MYKTFKMEKRLFQFIIGLCCLFFFFSIGEAAVVVDNSTSNTGFSNTGLTTLSVSHTISSTTSNRVLFVGVSTSTTTLPAGVPANRVDTVTFESQSAPGVLLPLTRVGSQISSDNKNTVEMFMLSTSPASGDGIVRINFTILLPNPNPLQLTNLLVNQAVGGVISFSSASLSTPPFFPSLGTGTSASSAPVTGGVGGDLVLDTIAASPTALSISLSNNSNQTRRWVNPFPAFNSYDVGAGSTEPVPASSPFTVVTEWNLENSDNWAIGALLIRQFVNTASPASIGGQVLTESNKPINGAIIELRNLHTGEVFNTITNEKGVYYFEGLLIANLYKMTVQSKFYTFSPDERIFSLTESLEGVDFYGSRRIRILRIIR